MSNEEYAQAIRRLATFARRYEACDTIAEGPVGDMEACKLALSYYRVWLALGKPSGADHRAVTTLLYGDRPMMTGTLARALAVFLDARQRGWRRTVQESN